VPLCVVLLRRRRSRALHLVPCTWTQPRRCSRGRYQSFSGAHRRVVRFFVGYFSCGVFVCCRPTKPQNSPLLFLRLHRNSRVIAWRTVAHRCAVVWRRVSLSSRICCLAFCVAVFFFCVQEDRQPKKKTPNILSCPAQASVWSGWLSHIDCCPVASSRVACSHLSSRFLSFFLCFFATTTKTAPDKFSFSLVALHEPLCGLVGSRTSTVVLWHRIATRIWTSPLAFLPLFAAARTKRKKAQHLASKSTSGPCATLTALVDVVRRCPAVIV